MPQFWGFHFYAEAKRVMGIQMSEAEQLQAEEPSVDVLDGAVFDSPSVEQGIEVSDDPELAPEQESEPDNTEEASDDVQELRGEFEEGQELPKTTPKGVEKYIKKERWKRGEAERQAESLAAQLAAAQARLEEFNRKPEPVVPEVPDPFSERFREEQARRDQAIRERAQWESQQAQEQVRRQDLQRQQQEAEERARIDAAAQYKERVEKSGLNEQEVEQALYAVADYKLPPHVGQALLADDHSPELVKFLADNPAEANDLFYMDAHHASVHIATTLRDRAAAALKPKSTKAPPPPTQLSGGGKASFKDPLLEGAVFK